jgi:hypothetical protein
MASEKCKTCGANCEGGDYCFRHKPRKPLSVGKKLGNSTIKSKNRANGGKNQHTFEEQVAFFLQIWNKRPHRSEINNEYLGKEPLTIFFHHILPKEKYPEACFDEENIILLTWEEHDNVERDIYKYPEINNRRELLKLKYERAQ